MACRPRVVTLPPMPSMAPMPPMRAARWHDRSFMSIRAERQGPAFHGARKTDVGQNDEADNCAGEAAKVCRVKKRNKANCKISLAQTERYQCFMSVNGRLRMWSSAAYTNVSGFTGPWHTREFVPVQKGRARPGSTKQTVLN